MGDAVAGPRHFARGGGVERPGGPPLPSGLGDVGGARDVLHRIAGVDDERRPSGELREVEGLVVGSDDDGVLGADGFLVPRQGFHALPLRVLAGGPDFRDVGIEVGDLGAECLETVEQLEGGRLAHVIDIRLAGEGGEPLLLTERKQPEAMAVGVQSDQTPGKQLIPEMVENLQKRWTNDLRDRTLNPQLDDTGKACAPECEHAGEVQILSDDHGTVSAGLIKDRVVGVAQATDVRPMGGGNAVGRGITAPA